MGKAIKFPRISEGVQKLLDVDIDSTSQQPLYFPLPPPSPLSNFQTDNDGFSLNNKWQALADAAQTKSYFWRFVLLQLSILRADILSDEMAEIEALLEEAVELVDASQPKNPNYYRPLQTLQMWKKEGGH